MAKIKWESKVEKEAKEAEKEAKKAKKEKFKGKKKGELTQAEINELTLLIAEELGLL